jgi:predicted transposase
MLVPRAVRLILQTQLLPDGDQARKLSATMRAFNAAADWLAGEAFRLKNANKVELQQLYYNQLRESGKSASTVSGNAGPGANSTSA